MGVKQKWAQDYIKGPVRSKDSYNDLYLATLKKEHYVYVMDFVPTAPGQVFEQPFFVDISNEFWISNVNVICYTTATQTVANTRAGFFSITDNTNQYKIFDNIQCGEAVFNPGLRSTLPQPYPIPASGSFSVKIDLPAIFSVVASQTMQLTIEGYKVFNA